MALFPAVLLLSLSVANGGVHKSVAIDWFSECGCTGIEVESVGLTRELLAEGFENTRLNTCNNRCPGQSEDAARDLEVLQSPRDRPADIVIIHVAYMGVCGVPEQYVGMLSAKSKPYLIARAMIEETYIDSTSALRCNAIYDEVWVPSTFHVDVFVRSGVDRSKIHIIPETIDFSLYDPEVAEPRELFPEDSGVTYTFLSVFKWEERKNWRVLVQAFLEVFDEDPTVGLYIKTSPYMNSDPTGECERHIAQLLRMTRGTLRKAAAGDPSHVARRVRVDPTMVRAGDMPGVYRGADAFVLPTHGEGWGLPLMEAMAMELPTIATNFGGQTDFMNKKNSFLIDVEAMVPGGGGGEMAEPDIAHLKKIMSAVTRRRGKAAARGRKARVSLVEGYADGAVGRLVGERLDAIAAHRCVSHPAVCSGQGWQRFIDGGP